MKNLYCALSTQAASKIPIFNSHHIFTKLFKVRLGQVRLGQVRLDYVSLRQVGLDQVSYSDEKFLLCVMYVGDFQDSVFQYPSHLYKTLQDQVMLVYVRLVYVQLDQIWLVSVMKNLYCALSTQAASKIPFFNIHHICTKVYKEMSTSSIF